MKRRIPVFFIAGLSLFLLIAVALSDSAETNDDSFISFRYASNLIHGNGLTFNPGERVEGYTNFLWTVLIAAGMFWFDPVLLSKVLGIIFSGLLLLSHSLNRRLIPSFWWFPVLYCALDPGVIRWATRGLETSFFSFLCWLIFWFYLRIEHNRGMVYAMGVFGALASMARPEGLLFMTLIGLGGLLDRNTRKHDILVMSGSFFVIFGPYVLWKLWYYGLLLPNTFYAKTGGGLLQAWRGFVYIVQSWNYIEFSMFCVVLLWLFFKRKINPLFLSGMVVLVYILYVVVIGGDSLGPDRFIVPVVAFFSFTIASIASQINTKIYFRGQPLILSCILTLLIIGNALPLIETVKHGKMYSHQNELKHPRTRLGLCLGSIAGPGDSVATSLIGRLPYYSGLYTYDVFGLIDPHIAHQAKDLNSLGASGHEKTDIDYILNQKPTFIVSPEPVISKPRERGWVLLLRDFLFHDLKAEELGTFKNLREAGYELLRLDCPQFPVRVKIWKIVSPFQCVSREQ